MGQGGRERANRTDLNVESHFKKDYRLSRLCLLKQASVMPGKNYIKKGS